MTSAIDGASSKVARAAVVAVVAVFVISCSTKGNDDDHTADSGADDAAFVDDADDDDDDDVVAKTPCGCRGSVPEGTLDIRCGQAACVGNVGYRCIGPNEADFEPSACGGCTPACEGRACGSDGCGSSCGSCPAGQSCRDGSCGCDVDCAGRSCGDDGCGGSCGSCAAGQRCRDGACCQPTCEANSCGDDGCGGSCGSCGTEQLCVDGECVSDAYCLTGPFGYSYTSKQYCKQGCCPGAPFKKYQSSGGTEPDCLCSVSCTPANSLSFGCTSNADCCSDSYCDTSGNYPGICFGGCELKSCSSSYGAGGCCESHKYCRGGVCRGNRGEQGWSCSDDLACDPGLSCVDDVCQAPCTPDCSGRQCGSDGCTGSCGSCASDEMCSDGQCVCDPGCGSKQCGADNCGGTCGECELGNACKNGFCVCETDCAGKSCGPDGCGGSCGDCGTGYSCSTNGQCLVDPDACDPVANAGCTPPNECVLLSSEETACALTGSGNHGSSCFTTSDCRGGHGCFVATCRKICELGSSAACPATTSCVGVQGWSVHGACK